MLRTRCPVVQKPIVNRFSASCTSIVRKGLVAFLLAAGPTHAVTGDEEPLRLDEAIGLTLRQHPNLAAFAHRREALQGRVQRARIGQRPELSLELQDALGTGRLSGLDQAQTTLGISWILDAELVAAQVGAAQEATTQVDVNREIRALNVAAETAALFVQDLAQQERLKLANQFVEQAEEGLSVARRRQAAGNAAGMEVLQAAAQLRGRQLEAEELVHELEAGRYELAAQWGGDRDYRPKGDLRALPEVGDFEHQLSALKNSPALRSFATRQRILESEMILARIEAKPRWQLSAGLRRYEDSDDFALVAGLTLPVGDDGRSAGRLQTLRAQQAEYAAEAEAMERRLDRQLYVLLLEIEHGLHLITALSDDIIPVLQKAQRQASHAYEIGQLNYLQWQDIRRQWLAARRNLITTYEATHLRHIELQRLTGASLTQ